MLEVLEGGASEIFPIALTALSLVGCLGALFIKDTSARRGALSVFAAILFGAVAITLKGAIGYALLSLCALVGWWAAKLIHRIPDDDRLERRSRLMSMAVALISLVVASFAFYRLGNYSSMALTWESPVIDDLVTELASDSSLMTSFSQRLRWNHGVLSGGANSLVFGFPALVGLRYVSADFWLLRLPAAVAFLGACVAFFLLTRRLLGLITAVSVLGVFGLNQVVLIYARYGSSAAGSLCAVLVAFLMCVRLIQTQRIYWAPVAVIALYIATLGYAPARIPVVVLVAMTPLGILLSSDYSLRRRLAAVGTFAIAVLIVLLFQAHFRATSFYFAARGEQFFAMLGTKYWPDEVRSLQVISLATKPLTPGEMIGVAIELVRQVTGPQLWALVDPFVSTAAGPVATSPNPFHDDPLFLRIIAPTLIPFVFLGLGGIAVAKRRWLTATLLIWVLACSASVLLSNRVDDHRLLFLVIPLSLWAAFGISLYARALGVIRLPGSVVVGIASAYCGLVVLARSGTMYDPRDQENPMIAAIREVVRDLPERDVTLMVDMFHRDTALLRLGLWRDSIVNGKRITWLSPHYKDALDRGTILYRPQIATEMAKPVKDGATLVLPYAPRYQQAASHLARQSLSVFSRSVGPYNFLVVNTHKEPYSSRVQRAILPEIPEEHPSSLVLPAATGVPLSSITPLSRKFGYSEMRLNRTWGGSPILMGGKVYESGLGIHSPTTLRYSVPIGATSFQAIIGIDDDALACARGSARLILRDQQGRLLHQTGVITNPRPTVVSVNVVGVKELEIDVTEADDGRDCDHVNIADALFVVPAGSAAACVCPKVSCAHE
jgi:hypothetical protein